MGLCFLIGWLDACFCKVGRIDYGWRGSAGPMQSRMMMASRGVVVRPRRIHNRTLRFLLLASTPTRTYIPMVMAMMVRMMVIPMGVVSILSDGKIIDGSPLSSVSTVSSSATCNVSLFAFAIL